MTELSFAAKLQLLKEDVDRAQAALDAAVKAKHDLLRTEIMRVHAIGINDMVKARRRGEHSPEALYVIRGLYSLDEMYANPDRKPWLRVSKLKKDGTPSAAEQTLFGEWDHAD